MLNVDFIVLDAIAQNSDSVPDLVSSYIQTEGIDLFIHNLYTYVILLLTTFFSLFPVLKE